ISIAFQAAGIRLNTSASLPIGLYKTTSDTTARLIAFCPPGLAASLSESRGYRGRGNCPDGAEPLLKPIVAASGDLVEVSPQGIAVNGRLLPNSAPRAFDTKHRPLPHWPFGNYRVAGGTVWVVSSYNPRSFDSRYFGPIQISSTRCRLQPLLTE
ncbi:MAG: conjugative transfer signal peptidase TraF, partial [Terriglobia bacterium]